MLLHVHTSPKLGKYVTRRIATQVACKEAQVRGEAKAAAARGKQTKGTNVMIIAAGG